MVVDKDVLEFGADFQLKSTNEFGVMIFEYKNIEKYENEVDFELPHVAFNYIVSEILKEKAEMV